MVIIIRIRMEEMVNLVKVLHSIPYVKENFPIKITLLSLEDTTIQLEAKYPRILNNATVMMYLEDSVRCFGMTHRKRDQV